ncbi:hypothetical protein Peur_059181 [Populus x canadensis]
MNGCVKPKLHGFPSPVHLKYMYSGPELFSSSFQNIEETGGSFHRIKMCHEEKNGGKHYCYNKVLDGKGRIAELIEAFNLPEIWYRAGSMLHVLLGRQLFSAYSPHARNRWQGVFDNLIDYEILVLITK